MIPFPIKSDYRLRRTPWGNYALLAANIIIYFAGYNAVSQANTQRIMSLMLTPGAIQLPQFFTSMFLHADIWHLLGNMIFLWVFGRAINDKFGNIWYLVFYLAGGVLSGLGYVLLSGTGPLLGASGAIAAVTGAYLVLLPRAKILVIWWLIILIIPLEMSSIYLLALQFGYNLFMSVYAEGARIGGGGIAYTAHCAGYVFGIGLSAVLLAWKIIPRGQYDLLALITQYRKRAKFRRMVNDGYDPFGRHRKSRKVAGKSTVTSWGKASSAVRGGSDISVRSQELRQEVSNACKENDLAAAARKYLELLREDENAVLPRQQQLDVSNQLMAENQHANANDAYVRFIKHYPNYEYIADIYLMLGIINNRYLKQYDKAAEFLQVAVERLYEPAKMKMAGDELQTAVENLQDK